MDTDDPMKSEVVIYISATVILAVAAIVSNSLLLSVIFAAEKISMNVANLLFLCIPHLELAVLALLHRSLEYGMNETALIETAQTASRNSTTLHPPSECVRSIAIESLERGAILWSIVGITSLAINQYMYIEKPFWYSNHVNTRELVIGSAVVGCVSHIIGLIPLMKDPSAKFACDSQATTLEINAYIIFATIVFLLFIVIIALSGRMIAIAEKHRRKMKDFVLVKKSRIDSMRFLIILVVTYIISNLTPVIYELVSLTNDRVDLAHMKLNILHLIAPTVYAILYGSRTPDGFLKSIQLAICCCMPVKPQEKDLEIEDAVRLAVMRLGNVMVKIDEQAAHKRHSSYLKSKTQLMSSISFLKPSPKPEGEHGKLRPYKSLVPTWKKQASTKDGSTEDHDRVGKSVSLDLDRLEKSQSHQSASRLFSWLPSYGSTKAKFDIAQKSQDKPNDEMVQSHVKLRSVNPSRQKLSFIAERPESIKRPGETKEKEKLGIKTSLLADQCDSHIQPEIETEQGMTEPDVTQTKVDIEPDNGEDSQTEGQYDITDSPTEVMDTVTPDQSSEPDD